MQLKPNTGLDVSDYQPNLLIGSLSPLPRFVIIKATESILFKAKLTKDFASQCKALGIPYGFYHFWQNADPFKQASNFIAQVNAAGGFERIPPVLDLEVANLGTYAANIKTWLDIVEDVSGKRPILYSNKYHFDMIAANPWFRNYDAWTAAYPADPDLWSWCPPLYSEKRARREVMWQYGSTYRYPNYTANSVDTNIAITEWLNEIGVIIPPSQEEATMETWKVIADKLNIRSGSSTVYTVVQSVFKGDKIEGVFDTASQWIDVSKIIRVNGSTFSPVAPAKWWCSGSALYVEKVVVTPPPPPVVDAVTLDIVLHDVKVAGDVYTANGVKAIKTA